MFFSHFNGREKKNPFLSNIIHKSIFLISPKLGGIKWNEKCFMNSYWSSYNTFFSLKCMAFFPLKKWHIIIIIIIIYKFKEFI